jgi:RNA polymerase sigma-70 factor (ECF subfamily)
LEKELLTQLKRNDQRALKVLFDQYHHSLCNLAVTIVRDSDAARDIVQEVFVKLWRNRDQLDAVIVLNAYLRRAVVNTSLNYLENSNTKGKITLDKADLTSHVSSSAHQQLEYSELREKVAHVVASLPDRTRTVYTLIRSEEMSYKEVAEALSISTKAVEKEIMKALRILREALREYLPSAIVLLVAGQFL